MAIFRYDGNWLHELSKRIDQFPKPTKEDLEKKIDYYLDTLSKESKQVKESFIPEFEDLAKQYKDLCDAEAPNKR